MEDGSAEPDLSLRPLSELRRGESGVVRRIAHEDHDLLARLSDLGVALGSRVEVSGDGGAAQGAVEVELDGRRRSIEPGAAAEVLVEAG
jgi:Fe2+ transport system protein FeoA